MDFQQLQQRAMDLRHHYAVYEQKKYGRSWTPEEVALGFVGDVGDLCKLVQAVEGVRNIPDSKEKLAHELADCVWSVMALANLYGVDLEDALDKMLRQCEAFVEADLGSAAR